ncbi:AmpG family muropeptide MFS transporter [Terricaulis silvestris]|uniref:Muropeptide transporter n=1 Tax=Terricaulis silvestris TaxID=2686094 RepID=A0A6I6MUB3_9CAUL|nr:permease [Terricaulis silvestris]QGZ96968.1 muropeptide transporter [Terricaulis silvestris]
MTNATEAAAPKRSTWDALAVFFEHRTIVMLMLGFAAGLPNLLLYDTISAWMRQAGVPLDVITLFSLVTITYAIKFLWAPIVDRVKIPGLHQLLGKRRSWMLLAQAGIVFGIWAIAVTMPPVSAAVAGSVEGAVQPDPNLSLIGTVAILAAITAIFGATQDIAIDAWRIEVAAVERQGAMAAAYQWGYRIAIVVSGAAPLLLASRIGWTGAYSAMALVMVVGVLGVLLAPRENSVEPKPFPPRTTPVWMEALEWIARIALMAFGACFIGAGLSGKPEPLAFMFPWMGLTDAVPGFAELWASKPWGAVWQVFAVAVGLAIVAFATYPMIKSRPSAYFAGTLKEPLEDFFKRYRSTGALILAMICVYRIADFVLNLMTAFYVDVGFTLDEIAGARKLFGVVMSMIGIGFGGWMVARFGLMRSLVVGAILQPLSNIAFGALVFTGPSLPGLYACIAIDNISAGVAGTALIAYMSSLTSLGFTATQYALFSSLYALPGKILAAISGRIVEGAVAASAAGESDWLRGWFTGMSPTAFARLSTERGIPAEAFAAGYMTFFIYSAIIGIAALVFALAVMRRTPPATDAAKEAPAPA